jgi:hypothetical protein
VGHKHIALRVNHQQCFKVKRTPKAHLNFVAHGHGVFGVELGGTLSSKCPSEQVGTKGIALGVF